MNDTKNSIKLWLVAVIIVSFILGAVALLVIRNIVHAEILQFSTIGLIGFVLSIIFGGASIVLAINAIQLGRSSEDAIIKRNDESIRTQNEVFQKTIEVLSRIESSTGVTEKRIEDIIAGRVGQIADKLSHGNFTDRDKIEKELRKSLTEELTSEEVEARKEIEIKRKEAKSSYEKYHEAMLLTLSNTDNFNVLKLGEHGSYRGEGVSLVDGLFSISELKVGISVYSKESLLGDMFVRGFEQFVTKVAQALSNGVIDYFFYISDEESNTSKQLKAQLKESSNLFKDDLKNRIFILVGTEEQLINEIKETAANKA
jgi:hypothetical protein